MALLRTDKNGAQWRVEKSLLETISLPNEIRTLSRAGLEQLGHELREELLATVSLTGGHLASNLGVVEISLALHHEFSAPKDKIVWDIGHQAYIHKMITGRRERMSSLRQKGGISGFLKRKESEYDSFGAGHAGTSVSAALGMRLALDATKDSSYVTAVIGDAAISSGMALEALNHAGDIQPGKFIVLLNDNEMSISPNVGALQKLCSGTCEQATAAAGDFFSMLGFEYFGPIDGNDLQQLLLTLGQAKCSPRPVIVHAKTVKGKAYPPAESDPSKWHGVSPFKLNREKSNDPSKDRVFRPPTFTEVFADSLCRLAADDPRIMAITAGMPTGTGLDSFHNRFPERFFDVGICEQHAVTLAAGMACEGRKPVCCIYSSFLQRAYDQVLHDVILQKLPVVFALDRAGLVGQDGETHQGAFDIGFLRTVPDITIMSPKDENELRHMLHTALQHKGPVALRYPRGRGLGVELEDSFQRLPIGKAELVAGGGDALIISFGPLTSTAHMIRERVFSELGMRVSVVNARFAKPLDSDLFRRILPHFSHICTLEDHALSAGFGSAIIELINDCQIPVQRAVKRFGILDRFVAHASQEEQHRLNAFDIDSVVQYFRNCWGIQQLRASA